MSAVIRSQKFLREKFGGVEDDMHEDDDEEDEEEPMGIWGGKMNQYYNADNRDFEVIWILYAICPIFPLPSLSISIQHIFSVTINYCLNGNQLDQKPIF